MAVGDNILGPGYMTGMAKAVPTGRESSRLRRAAQRLRRQGFRAEAGQMMLDAEKMRLNEPSIMTPGYRSAVAQGREVAAAAQRSIFDDTLDFERDIAPMRQQFFQNLSGPGITPQEREMLANRFAPLLDHEVSVREERARKARKEELAFEQAQLNLQNVRKATKQQREVEGLLPNVVAQIDPIIMSASPSSDKIAALSAVRLKNPRLMTDPRLAAVFNTAYSQVAGQREDEKIAARQKFDTALAAARTGSPDVVREFYGPDDAIGRDLGALASAVRSGNITKRELDLQEEGVIQRQKGLESYLGRLDNSDKEINSAMAAFARGKDDAMVPTQAGGGKALPVLEFRKMQFERVARILRDIVGQEQYDKTPFADVDLETIKDDELVKQFSSLLRHTRDAISDKRDAVFGRRYNSLTDKDPKPAAPSTLSEFQRAFGVPISGQ